MYPERLKRAREAAGLSLRALAEQVGVSHAAIKNTKMVPTPQTLAN